MGIFRKRRRRDGMSSEASLAQAEAARRQQERKREYAEYVKAKLERAQRENDVAALLRRALGGRA